MFVEVDFVEQGKGKEGVDEGEGEDVVDEVDEQA